MAEVPSSLRPPDPCALPSGSPYAAMPAPLRETLCRSYAAHVAGTNRYLDNAFWGGPPRDFEAALRSFDAPAFSAVRQVYDRAAAVPSLWGFIQYVHNAWASDSLGFTFTCPSKPALRTFLDASPSFCRDIPLMQSDHQSCGPAQCWREVVNAGPGLHICLINNDTIDQATVAGESGIHVDPNQIVEGREADGVCNYSAWGAVRHGRDVGAGVVGRRAAEARRQIEGRLRQLLE